MANDLTTWSSRAHRERRKYDSAGRRICRRCRSIMKKPVLRNDLRDAEYYCPECRKRSRAFTPLSAIRTHTDELLDKLAAWNRREDP